MNDLWWGLLAILGFAGAGMVGITLVVPAMDAADKRHPYPSAVPLVVGYAVGLGVPFIYAIALLVVVSS